MTSTPSFAVKEHNRNAIARYLYAHAHATKQELERELGLSLPTITQNLRMLDGEGLITRGALQESTGGRKARSYEFNARHRVSIGVSMRPGDLVLCAVDLHGNVIAEADRAIPYRNTNAYYQRIGGIVNDFAAETEKDGTAALGVVFSVQGIVSADGTAITFGAIMGNTGLTLDVISQSVHYPCIMIRDCAASAMAELWADPTLTDAVCIYLDRRPGGAGWTTLPRSRWQRGTGWETPTGDRRLRTVATVG